MLSILKQLMFTFKFPFSNHSPSLTVKCLSCLSFLSSLSIFDPLFCLRLLMSSTFKYKGHFLISFIPNFSTQSNSLFLQYSLLLATAHSLCYPASLFTPFWILLSTKEVELAQVFIQNLFSLPSIFYFLDFMICLAPWL